MNCSTLPPLAHFAWNYLVQLREEILNLQNIRARLVVAKTVTVGGGVGILAQLIAKQTPEQPGLSVAWLALPAFVAFAFDTLIDSYTWSIKRNGAYIRDHLEPKLGRLCEWPSPEPLWEKYVGLRQPGWLRHMGSLLLTCAATLVGLLGAGYQPIMWLGQEWRWAILASLVILLILDVWLYVLLQRCFKADPHRQDEAPAQGNPAHSQPLPPTTG